MQYSLILTMHEQAAMFPMFNYELGLSNSHSVGWSSTFHDNSVSISFIYYVEGSKRYYFIFNKYIKLKYMLKKLQFNIFLVKNNIFLQFELYVLFESFSNITGTWF